MTDSQILTALSCLITNKQIETEYGLTRFQVYGRMQNHKFPTPLAVIRQQRFWSRAAVSSFFANVKK
jgi:hypothetical protein